MVALNFQSRFAADVAARRKRQTIRKTARCKPGDMLQLYTGMRTKACRKLVADDPVCASVTPISIGENCIVIGTWVQDIEGEELIARLDGFYSVADFKAFFRDTYGLPFDGFLIKWNWFDAD